MMGSTSPSLLSPLGTQRSNSPSSGSLQTQDFGVGGYAASELNASQLSPSPSSMATTTSHDAHDMPPSAGSRKKNFKTEYKSKFTPFDQYAYNEVTDSFVKQTTTNLESHPPSSICTSKSNQDLAHHQQESSHSHMGAQQIPTIDTHEASLCGHSVNGEDHQQAPWYKEVVKRNEKANEYRFKSEIGHNSPLLGYTSNRSDSPHLNSELSRQINSPFGDALSTAGSEQVAGNMSDARSQHSEYPADLSQQDAKQKYRFTPSDYKRTDHMIAHMANNNNFALPKDQADQQHSAASRRAQASSAGAKVGAIKSTAQVRSRSQSTRRQPTSMTSSANARAQPAAKSSQTTPTKTTVSRPPTTRAPLASARPSTRVTSNARTSAVGDNSKPTSTAPSKPGVGSSRITSASTNRRVPTSSNPTSRLTNAKPKPTSNGTNQTNRPVSSSVASKKPAVPSTRTAPLPRTSTSAKPTTKPTTNSSAIAAGRLPPTNTKASSSSRTTAAAIVRNKVATNKAPPPPSTTNTVKSIKTSKAIAAEEAASVAVSKKLNDQPNQAASEYLENKQQSDRSQFNNEPNLAQPQQHRYYDNNEPNLIFTTTPAGNMLADELAQAEKAALDAKKAEISSVVESKDTQKELDKHDNSSSPDSTVDKWAAGQSAGSRQDSGEKEEIKEAPQPDLYAPSGGETDNDHNESGLDDTLYVTAISGGDTTHDGSQLIETGGTLVDDFQSNVPASRRFSLETELAQLRDSRNDKSEHGDDLIVKESEFLVDTSPVLESANTTINGASKTEEPVAQKSNSEALPQSESCDSITEALTARVSSTPDKSALEEPTVEQPPVEEAIEEQEPVLSKEILLTPEDLELPASLLEDPKAPPQSFFPAPDDFTTREQAMRQSSSFSSSSSSSDEDEQERRLENQDSQQQAAAGTGTEAKLDDSKEILLSPEDLVMPTSEPEIPVAQAPISESSTARHRSTSESSTSSSSSSSSSLPPNKNRHKEDPKEHEGQLLVEETKTEPKPELEDPGKASGLEQLETTTIASGTPKVQPYSLVSVPEASEEPSNSREPGSPSSSSTPSSEEEKPEKQVEEHESQEQIAEEVKTEPMLVDFNKIFEADDLVIPTSATEPLKAQPDSLFPIPETSSAKEPSQPDGDETEKQVERRDSQQLFVEEAETGPMLVDFNKTFEEDDLVMPTSAPDTPKVQPYSFFEIPENSTAMIPSGPDDAGKQGEGQRLVEEIQIVDKASDTKQMHQDSSGTGESVVQTSTAETPRTQPDSFDMFLMDGPNSSRAHLESEDKLF